MAALPHNYTVEEEGNLGWDKGRVGTKVWVTVKY
jgi:hypothetical protein